MTRSDMVRKMTEFWLGLYPHETYVDVDLQLEVHERMSQMLSFLEYHGMKAPLEKKCPVLLSTEYVWGEQK